MRILANLRPLRNIEPSDLNVQNPWKSAKMQRIHSNENMGIQNIKNLGGTPIGGQNLPPGRGRGGTIEDKKLHLN